MTDVKKNLITLTFILSGILIILVTLNFQEFGKNEKAQILETDDNLNNLPVRISKGMVSSFDFENSLNKIVFYEKADSMIYEAASDGKNKKELAKIPGASEIVFSPNNKELIATIKETDRFVKYYFNLENNQKVKLDRRIKTVIFSPDGKKIAYHFYDGGAGEGNISVSNPDGSGFINIFKTRSNSIKLLWPENDSIIFYQESENNEILAFSIKPDEKEFRKLPETEYLIYLNQKPKEEILKNLGIKALEIKLSFSKDYLIFINAKDGKLYSLNL